MIATINELFFPILLFIFTFTFLSCITPTTETTNQVSEEIQRLDQFTTNIKEALSSKYDPSISENQSLSNHVILALPPTRRKRHHNTTPSIHNSVLVTPVGKTQVKKANPTTSKFKVQSTANDIEPKRQSTNKPMNQMGIRDLRAYVREYNLQSTIKKLCGKTISKCNKGEIIKALQQV